MKAWVEIDLGAVERNVELVKKEIGNGVELMVVVKSDAYGHGLDEIVKTIDHLTVNSYAVVSIEEAYKVKAISNKPILIMGYLDTKEMTDAISEGFILSLYDKEMIPTLERFALRIGQKARVHLKVETGLNRLGIDIEDAIDFIINQRHFPNIKLEAVFSHLYKATDKAASVSQLRQLQELIVAVSDKAPLVPMHLASSSSLGQFKEGYLDSVRVGLAIYGMDKVLPGLECAFQCKTLVMQVKQLLAGEGVGYNHHYKTDKPMTVAVLPVGYADGFSQDLAENMNVLVQGIKKPVLGEICMNHITVNVTGLEVKRGDEVILIGSQKRADGSLGVITVDDVAKKSNIRHHEIITRLGRGLPRKYTRG